MTSSKEGLDTSGLSRNSHCHKKQTKWQVAELNTTQAKVEKVKVECAKLKEMINPTNVTKAKSQAVSSLQIWLQSKQTMTGKNNQPTSETVLWGKPFLSKPRPFQLSPAGDGSLDPELFCQYSKNTGHLKANSIYMNWSLARERQMANSASAYLNAPSTTLIN